MNIDELERLSEAATDGPFDYWPCAEDDTGIGHYSLTSSTHENKEVSDEDAELLNFLGTHRKAILRMLRAGEKMATTIEGELHSPKCHLNSSRPFGSKLREEWDAKGCDCWKSVLKEYQTAKESI